MTRIRDLQRRANDLFLAAGEAEARGEAPAGVRFSPFVPEHVDSALELVDRWIKLTEEGRGNDGLAAALEDAERELAADPERAQHALMIFITHNPQAARLPVPALEERRPDLAARAVESSAESLEAVGGEGQLDWFREDPLANQHHEHWHVVYPVSGVPDGRGGATGKDRQGELFFYMHQQMLARYDAERIAAGLGPVKPFATYTSAIAEGYDSGLPDFRARSPNRRLATVNLGGGPYSWHRHIDDQLARWQEKQPPHDFSDAPRAAARPPLFVFSDTVPQASRSGAALQTWAKRTFGGTKWANAFEGSPLVTRELETGTRTRSTPAGPLEHLDHRDFLYVLRLENKRAQATDVTVRLFLAPKSAADNRRMWIEMDRNEDQVSHDAHCGSMSFCGVRDASYPDRRPMGYPFDRPLPAGTTLDAVVAGRPNMATRDLAIRFGGRL